MPPIVPETVRSWSWWNCNITRPFHHFQVSEMCSPQFFCSRQTRSSVLVTCTAKQNAHTYWCPYDVFRRHIMACSSYSRPCSLGTTILSRKTSFRIIKILGKAQSILASAVNVCTSQRCISDDVFLRRNLPCERSCNTEIC